MSKFIKLINEKTRDESGEIFMKDSILQVIAESKKTGELEAMPIDAYCDDGLPHINGQNVYTFSTIKPKKAGIIAGLYEGSYTLVKPMHPKIASFGLPSTYIEQDDDDTAITLALKDTWEDKDFITDRNGNISKKSEFNKNLPEDNSMDFAEKVDGSNDPGITDDYKSDEKEKPATKPIYGPLAKLKILKKKVADMLENNMTGSDADASIDFNTSLEGSDQPGITDTYKEDTAEKPASPPILGDLAKLKREYNILARLLKKSEDEKKVKMIWKDGSGETNTGTILEGDLGGNEIIIDVDEGDETNGEGYLFEKGVDGNWYEANNSDVPVAIQKMKQIARLLKKSEDEKKEKEDKKKDKKDDEKKEAILALKKQYNKMVDILKKKGEDADKFKIDIPSDGSAGGDNLSDYEIDDSIEGGKDEFRPKGK